MDGFDKQAAQCVTGASFCSKNVPGHLPTLKNMFSVRWEVERLILASYDGARVGMGRVCGVKGGGVSMKV